MKKHAFLSDYSDIADMHAERLKGSLTKTEHFMPMTADVLSKLPLEQVAFLDMMSTRFGKLQDIIGAKIFPLILEILGEDAVTFIDKLNRLDKLGYIDDVSWWMDLRELRNEVMHDYPDDYKAISEHMSILVVQANKLLQFWEALKKKIELLPKKQTP